jgi:hypothetical protein
VVTKILVDLSTVEGVENEGHAPDLVAQLTTLLVGQHLTVTTDTSTARYVVGSVIGESITAA